MHAFQKWKKENFQRRPALGYSTPQKETLCTKILLLKRSKSIQKINKLKKKNHETPIRSNRQYSQIIVKWRNKIFEKWSGRDIVYGFKKQKKKSFQCRSIMEYPTPQKKCFFSKKLSVIFTQKKISKTLVSKMNGNCIKSVHS